MSRLPCLAAALVSACNSAPSVPAPIEQHVALRAVTSCPAVERAVQDAAVVEMRATLEASLHWRALYGDTTTASAGGNAGAPQASPPASYTTTNLQVPGVDEPDFVKNDGTRIFTLSGQKLLAASSWPADGLALTRSLSIEGWPISMFLDEHDRIAVISQVPSYSQGVSPALCPIAAASMCGFWGPATTKLTVVDASSLAVKAEAWLPGYSAHARRIGSRVHVVLTDPPRWPETLQWWPNELGIWSDAGKFADAIHRLEARNEAIIRATPLARWLPPAQRKLEGGETVEAPYDCAQFRIGNAPVRLGFVTLATLDLDHPEAAPSRLTIVGEGGMVYASAKSLYVASGHWWWWPADGNMDWTYVHKFDLSQPSGPEYVASGGFSGHPLDQFSLDESAAGDLRVAVNTTKLHIERKAGDPWPTFRSELGNAVRVLDAQLKLSGEIEPLSPGEWVRSSRFLGDRGFVVTFKQIDPLFALDLSDPVHPLQKGVLEVPGFSTYLQPLDADHLLAIGVDMPADTTNWRDRSLQLSVFDVSDLTAPKRTAQLRIGSAWSYSEALWDHHAFNWYPEKNLLAVPFADWEQTWPTEWGTFSSDLRVYEVHGDSIAARGALSMKDVYVTYGKDQWTWSWSPWIRRSVMASAQDGSTFVYAVSDAGIRAAPLSDLTSPIATALFPPQW